MAVNTDDLDMIAKLRGLGVIHYKRDFEVTLGYPFGEPTKQAAVGSSLPVPERGDNAADLVLSPPDLSKAVEE